MAPSALSLARDTSAQVSGDCQNKGAGYWRRFGRRKRRLCGIRVEPFQIVVAARFTGYFRR